MMCSRCSGDIRPWGVCQCEDKMLKDRIRNLEAVAEKYQELLYQVACKFPNETRHETALRYLRQAETPNVSATSGHSPALDSRNYNE
jgi:hypothetical protein